MSVLSLHGPAALAPRERHSGWVAKRTRGRWVKESHLPHPTARPPMIRITRLPEEVMRLLLPYTQPELVLRWSPLFNSNDQWDMLFEHESITITGIELVH